MTRLVLPLLFAALALQTVPTSAAGETPAACAVLSQAEAAKLAGAPLGEIAKGEVKASDQNGNDHQTSCGYFPKGYHIDKADGPPDSGLLVELHAFRSADDAKRFYEGVLGMHMEMAKARGNAGAGGAVTTVSGIGEGAYLLPTVLPNPAAKIVTLTTRKGSIVASVQVWKNAAPVDPIARAAGARVVAKLP